MRASIFSEHSLVFGLGFDDGGNGFGEQVFRSAAHRRLLLDPSFHFYLSRIVDGSSLFRTRSKTSPQCNSAGVSGIDSAAQGETLDGLDYL